LRDWLSPAAVRRTTAAGTIAGHRTAAVGRTTAAAAVAAAEAASLRSVGP